VRTTIGQERSVTDLITTAVIGETDVWQCPFCSEDFSSEKATKEHMSSCKKKKKKIGEPQLVSTNQLLGRVKAILVPETLRGYVFIETTEFRDVEIAISGVPHVRGRVGGKVSFDEIDKFLVPPPAAEGLGTGDVVEAVRHARSVLGEIRRLQNMPNEELMAYSKEIQAPYEIVKETKELGRLPVVNFAAGGIATPADAALMMQLGVDGNFVGSGIFKSGDPANRAVAIVKATTHYDNPEILSEISKNLGEPMVGRQISDIPENELIADRGW